MRLRWWWWGLFILVLGLGAVGQLGRIYGPLGSGWRDLTLVQLIAFPVFSLCAWHFVARFPGAIVSRGVVGLFFLLGVAVSLSGYSFRTHDHRAVLLARLGGDEFDSQSRIFRDRLDTSIKAFHRPFADGVTRAPRTVRYHSSITDRADATKVLRRAGGAQAVIWGSERWLQVSFPESGLSPQSLQDYGRLPHPLGHLQLTRGVPLIGLSLEPSPGTLHFLAGIITGIVNQDERLFELAAAAEAFWTSAVHRALPALWLGNAALQRALHNGTYDGAELDCALAWYQTGVGYMPNKEHRELLSALENNRAVALFVRGTFEHRFADRKAARQLWRSVVQKKNRVDRYKLPPRVVEQALMNLAETEQSAVWGARKKKKHKIT